MGENQRWLESSQHDHHGKSGKGKTKINTDNQTKTKGANRSFFSRPSSRSETLLQLAKRSGRNLPFAIGRKINIRYNKPRELRLQVKKKGIDRKGWEKLSPIMAVGRSKIPAVGRSKGFAIGKFGDSRIAAVAFCFCGLGRR